jgi:PAS domain S-box-containing protein
VWDPEFIINRFNQAFERLSGYTANEIVGRHLGILFPRESSEKSLEQIQKTLAGEQWESVEIPIHHKYGSIHIALWNSANIYDGDMELRATIAQGQDITERKQAERDLEEAKDQAELYLDLMGHDISNMHQIMMMQLELASETLKLNGKLEGEDEEMILTSARTLEKAAKLIDNVRKLQKLRAGEYGIETIDLAVMLQDVLNMYRSIPGREIRINYTPCANSLVQANPLLKDVFGNLVDNAVKYSSGLLEIGVDVHKVGMNGSTFYRVAIEDNGVGIPDEKKDEVFRRFKRGQTKVRGTGLGLYLVKSLVEGFGGYVEIENRVLGDYTKGTRFLVYMPQIKEGKDAAE